MSTIILPETLNFGSEILENVDGGVLNLEHFVVLLVGARPSILEALSIFLVTLLKNVMDDVAATPTFRRWLNVRITILGGVIVVARRCEGRTSTPREQLVDSN